MDTPGVPVAWCTTAAVRRELEAASPQLPVEWTTPEDPFGDAPLAVLDTRAFGNLPLLLEKRSTRPARPVLVVCAPREVGELIDELTITDDIALHDSPVALLEFRLQRLGAESGGRDALTGLFNYRVLYSWHQRAIEDASRLPVSLLIVDLDNFKRVNDRYGHSAADQVLREAAVRVSRVAPSGSLVARLAGDKFGILDSLAVSEAVAVADEIAGAFRTTPFGDMDITVSIGCATSKALGESLFMPADEALYAAKAKGRNRVVHYDEIARRAREQDRDPALEGLDNRTRVIAERMTELITRRGRKLFEGLKAQADADALTGLFGRRYLDRRLPFEFEVSSAQNIPLTVALLDLDHFGAVNKMHGLPTGDRVLVEVANRIRRATRADDWVARYGGEEICVVMHGTPLDVARPALERIRSAVAGQPFTTTAGNEIEVTLSGGAAERTEGETLETLMERASQKLLSAKQGGRNRIVT
jgi:diguanylate cyclase (GGDEF)-like protein